MIKGLNRPMFSGMQQQPTGLGAFQGEALQQRGMPMGGIMRFAEGGEADKEESVAENYRQMKTPYNTMGTGEGRPGFVNEGSFLDYILKGGSGGLRGDVSEAASLGLSAIPDTAIRGLEALGLDITDKEAPTYEALLGAGDYLMGIENRLPSETIGGEEITWGMDGEMLPASQAEEINAALRGEAEKAVADPQANEAAAAVTGAADEKLKKAENNEDIYGGMLALVPDAQVSDDPEENRKEVMRRLQQQASSMGIELADDEADPQTNPHIGTALILAGGAMMQQTGNVGQAIGKGLETGASFLANKAEKEAERAADIEEATIRSMYGGTDAAVIQEAREAKRVYGAAFPNATDADFFNFAVRSTQADPALVEQTLVDNMLKEGSEESASVASNYAKMFVNSQTASGLGEDNPKVAIGPNGQTFTIREMEARASEFLKQPEAKSSGITSIPKAINAMGYRPIPLDQISKMSNIPAEGE
jgi:hypothetical protein